MYQVFLLKAIRSGSHGSWLLQQELQIKLQEYSSGKLGPLSAFALFTLVVLVGTRSTEFEGHLGRLTPKTDGDQQSPSHSSSMLLPNGPVSTCCFLVAICKPQTWGGGLSGSSLSLAGQAVFLYFWQHSGHYPASMSKIVIITGSHRGDLLRP